MSQISSPFFSPTPARRRAAAALLLFLLAVLLPGASCALPENTAAGAPSQPDPDYVQAAQEAAKAMVRSAAARTVLTSAAAAAVTYGLAIITAFSILYFGSWTRQLLRQTLDAMSCLSPMVFLLLIYAARQNVGHFLFVFLAVAIFPLVGRPLLARVSEASHTFYFTEAKVLGHSYLGVFRHYAWPRFLPLTVPYFFLGFIHSLLVESMFSSLGLIHLAGGHTWGSLIHLGLEGLLDHPWTVFFAGFAIMATTLAAYLCVPLLDRLLSPQPRA